MIRPIDIQEKEFTRGVRGYKEEEVNEFLDEITIDLERLLDELRATKEENSRLVTELERHRGTEGTVLERIPPRLKVRENAIIELPHIMMQLFYENVKKLKLNVQNMKQNCKNIIY